MSIYSTVYLIISIILISHTMKNRLDLLSVCTICFIVYSIYCIPGMGISGFYRPSLSPKLYYLIYTQMFTILAFSMMTRQREKYKSKKRNDLNKKKFKVNPIGTFIKGESGNKTLDTSFKIYTAIMVIFVMINIFKVGFSGFAAGKETVWEQTNILFIISLYGSFPAFAYGLHNKKKIIWIPSLLIELLIFFSGSRAFTATLIIIFICEKGYEFWKKRKSNLGICVIGGLAIAFLLLYRTVDTYIMKGDIGGAIQQLQEPLTWFTAFEFNEPRVIIANYDYALTTGIELPMGDIIYRFTDFIPGLNSLLSIKIKYPEYFSDWLTSSVHGSTGVGGSIWGESHAMFGIFGVIIFTLLWLCFVRFANKHLSYYKEYSCFIVSLGIYLSWYINRLDFNRVGQVTKITFMCFLIWGTIYLLLGGTIKIFNHSIYFRKRINRMD